MNQLVCTDLITIRARPQLREALMRLDTVARGRIVAAGGDVERLVAAVSARVEARAHVAVREGLRRHAWLAIGLALGLGALVGARR